MADASPNGGGYARLGPPDSPVRLYYSDTGTGSPVLLIHGFGSSTYTWQHIMPGLARKHRVIAVDMKGFGQSDKPYDERYSAMDQAELLAELMEREDLRDVTLVGHSFGGGVALALALQADGRLKGRISKLVLIDTIAYPQKIPVFFKLLGVPGLSHLSVRMVPASMQVSVALKLAYYDESKITDETLEAYTAPLRTAAGKYAVIHSARQIVPPDLDEIAARYNTIQLPTLIMWCDHDKIVPMDIGLKLRRNMPNSDFQLVKSCGHIPQEEQPEQTLQILDDFLDGRNQASLSEPSSSVKR
ncbi:alpha/beta fold hydrolase [Methyloligella solikamskensis]|uniref:Alpha/beta fold hydrolase n=1 Tax=Methyloligella solikamskensis TaxID=1177756 RepID=A0ABW3JE83_9HYPH